MIEARGLVKHYRSTPAVNNLSFDVRPGHRDRLPWPERRRQGHGIPSTGAAQAWWP
jgi:hypothetical protein